jgi:hypothetical protein
MFRPGRSIVCTRSTTGAVSSLQNRSPIVGSCSDETAVTESIAGV